MRIALVLAGSLLLGSVAAQETATPKPQEPAKASVAECMQQIQDLQQKAITDWRADRKQAAEAAKGPATGKPVKAMRMRPDFGPVTKMANRFAKQFAGSDDAVPFLMIRIVEIGTVTPLAIKQAGSSRNGLRISANQTPGAPRPSITIEIVRNAKWYQTTTLSTRVSAI